ncbi:unknown [Clostridium sp. CAG:628]|nr:unknown [Clostridium sp. CAG:628]
MKVNNTFNKDNLQLQNEKSSLSIEGEQIAKDKLNKKGK